MGVEACMHAGLPLRYIMMSKQRIGECEDLLSSSGTSIAKSTASRVRRLESSIRMLEHQKQQLILKTEELKASTAMTCAEIRVHLLHHKRQLVSLQQTYTEAREHSAEAAKIASIRSNPGDVADILEGQFAEKRQLTEERGMLYCMIQDSLECIQQLTQEREMCQFTLSGELTEKERSLRQQLDRLISVRAQWKAKIEELSGSMPLSKLSDVSEGEAEAKKMVTADIGVMTSLKTRQLELEVQHKTNLREVQRLTQELLEERSKNQQREKRLAIRCSEVTEEQDRMQDMARLYQEGEETRIQLEQGLQYLAQLHQTTATANTNKKQECSAVWAMCKRFMERAEHLQRLFLANSDSISRIHQLCSQVPDTSL